MTSASEAERDRRANLALDPRPLVHHVVVGEPQHRVSHTANASAGRKCHAIEASRGADVARRIGKQQPLATHKLDALAATRLEDLVGLPPAVEERRAVVPAARGYGGVV